MPRRKQKGFSLLDIVMALFVTVTLMLMSASLLIGGRRLSQQSQIQSAAYQMARLELETLRTLKFANRPITTGSSFTIPTSISNQFPEQSFKGTFSVQPFGALSSPPMQQIVVIVSWNRVGYASGVTSKVQLDSLAVQEPGR